MVGPSPGSGEAEAPPRSGSSLSSEVEVESEPQVGRGVDRHLGPRPSPSPRVGRGGVRRLPGPRPSPSPGVGRGRASYGARGRTWLLSASLCRAAQQSERCRRRCPLVRPVSGAAKWLRSLRLCRLEGAHQDKVSGLPCFKCFCDTVGRCGDMAKVASWRRLGLRQAEGVSVAWGGPRARRESSGVGCPCPRLGSGEARSCPLSGPSLDLITPIRPLQLCADGGYQLRLGVLGVPLIMVPDSIYRCRHEFCCIADRCFHFINYCIPCSSDK
jgi:hypothetical protein